MRGSNKQVVFLFGEGNHDAEVLGGKGAGLAEMARLGVSVPPGFTVTTTVARAWKENNRFPQRFEWQFQRGIALLERQTGKKFGNPTNPLLVSVRSGARVSMPGMMDTILNLGLNPEIISGLAKVSGSEHFAWDCYRRFLEMFGQVVLGLKKEDFGLIGEPLFQANPEMVCLYYRKVIFQKTGNPIPDEPLVQLKMAIEAVFGSWDTERARDYRRVNSIPEWWETAVNVQAMVFGNLGEDSGTGVVFSRNVSTGEPGLYGEFLVNAQGEDVVAGVSTPLPIAKMQEWNPALFGELTKVVKNLEVHYNDVVDVEFTIEKGRLFVLQVRVAKRTPAAALVIATQMVWEKHWTKEVALSKVSAEQITAVGRQVFEASALEQSANRILGEGLPASPGSAVGRVVFTSAEAVAAAEKGEKVILVRPDTSPDDLSGMLAAAAIVTEVGGATSHAAVVARGLGKPAVVNAEITELKVGSVISVDGTSGQIFSGELPLVCPAQKKEVNIFLRWLKEKFLGAASISKKSLDEEVSVNQLINDFYLVEAMAIETKGTSFETSVADVRKSICTDTAERLLTYLVVAIASELRHYKCQDSMGVSSDYDTLRKKFGIENENISGDTNYIGFVQKNVVLKLSGMSLADQTEYFHLANLAFSEGNRWNSSYGGKAWADIAKTGKDFLEGKLPVVVFIDHTFDLQHNNGSVFGKHHMIGGYRDVVKNQLERKKKISGVSRLFFGLRDVTGEFDFSDSITDLFERGQKAGVWNKRAT